LLFLLLLLLLLPLLLLLLPQVPPHILFLAIRSLIVKQGIASSRLLPVSTVAASLDTAAEPYRGSPPQNTSPLCWQMLKD